MICTASVDGTIVFSSLVEGAAALVTETAPSEELREAILEASRNRIFLCRLAEWEALERLGQITCGRGTKPLTQREQQVCIWLCSRRAKDVARTFPMTLGTIQTHGRAIYEKLGVHSRSELIHQLTCQQSGSSGAGESTL